MAAQVSDPNVGGGRRNAAPASFLFHLGDVVYKDEDPKDPNAKDQSLMYNSQFYSQYTSYQRKIFAIAGNHDAKSSAHRKRSAIDHFLQNFCAGSRTKSDDNQTDGRLTMAQPYPYWLLETAVAWIIGLATNDINGGQLDDPMETKNPQYQWLVSTLKSIKQQADNKVIFLALHYPPYSGAQNFAERGNPNLGPTPRRPAPAGVLQPLGNILQQAFHESGQYPDVASAFGACPSLPENYLHSIRRLADTLFNRRQRRAWPHRKTFQDMLWWNSSSPRFAIRCRAASGYRGAKGRFGRGCCL
jgi:hypothetical protein